MHSLLSRLGTIQILTMVALSPCAMPARAAPIERPNIVLIIGDDLGWPYYGFAEPDVQLLDTIDGLRSVNEIAQTPNLDALAEGGTLFRSGYTTASVCVPSLQTLLSAAGEDPLQWQQRRVALQQTDIGDIPYRLESQYFRTLPRELQRYGYRSWEGGKMWEGNYADAGFTDGLAEERITTLFGIDGGTFGRDGWDVSKCGSTGDGTPCPALDPLRQFFDGVGGEPFFLWFAPMLPHGPFDAPEPYKDELRALGLLYYEVDYLANVRWLDELVGELLAELDNRGLRENTLVVYLSDNGWGLGLQFYPGSGRGKHTPYDIGSRTPVIFSWPGHLPAADLPDLVLSSDIATTILSFAQAARTVPEAVGTDLRPRILGGAPIGRTEIIQHDPTDTVLRPPWRYLVQEDGTEELYRIDLDPFEFENLAADYPDLVLELRGRAHSHRQELLTPPARTEILGRVMDASSSPVVGGQVRYGRDHVASTDSGGWFVIGPLAPGTEPLSRQKRLGPLAWTQSFRYVTVPFAAGGVFLPISADGRGTPPADASGRIRGVVLDAATGLPIEGAKVRLKSRSPSTTPRTLSEPDGSWLLEGLPANTYRIQVRARGHRKAAVSDVLLEPGDTVVDAPISLVPR